MATALGGPEAPSLRLYESRDIARRLGTITPDRLFLNGFPVRNPVAAFNPGMIVDGRDVVLFPRIIVGYYKYVSAVVEARIPLDDILDGSVSMNTYSSTLALTPSTKYDLWGVEDPRAYRLGERLYITYTGRTLGYFNTGGTDRTLPITAARLDGEWEKLVVHKPPEWLEGRVSNDKNAFVAGEGGSLLLFHRPQLLDGSYMLLASQLQLPQAGGMVEVRPGRSWLVMEPASFEVKIGWGPPPVRVRGRDYLFLLHGVGREMQAYRVFAALIELSPGEGPVVKAVTRRYLMEPRESYELYGDRPYTVFPCGLASTRWGLLVSYGGADYVVGFALLDMDEVLGELDRGRIY
ncbi:MAG: glycosidase [Desulfurococcales archaeon]|nr:glycosidase [Desulfurococcales archaeon]